MGSQFIIFCLLLIVCSYANGARNIVTKTLEIISEPYVTNYGATKLVKELEVSEPYMTNYGRKKSGEEVVETEPYMTNYGAKKTVKEMEISEPYMTNYGTKEENAEPYITSYGTKEENVEPYITSYGTKEGTEDVEAQYITQYGTKEGKAKEVEPSYITQYGTKEGKEKSTEAVEIPYITQYGDKKASYTTQDDTKEDTLESKDAEATYITGYISAQGTKRTKEIQAPPYITGYISAQDAKDTKEVEAPPYITGYISAQGAKNCDHEKHNVHPPSQNGAKESPMAHEHRDHMHHAQSSSPMDHTEALKQGFFTLEDFYKGNALPLNFPKQEHSRFLHKETADSIPFSTSQLPHLLQLFSTPRDSREGKHMAWTLDQCELKPINGETKFCATSLESMTEFVRKIIGSGVSFNILSTTLPETSTAITQKYTILEDPKQVIASKMVFCHPVPYPYAVFFCHHFENDTKFFKVSLRGENGDNVEAVAVCHMDTSDWDPNHALFRLLGIKAGASSPVCHFFPANHLVWLPSSPTTAIF